MGRGAKPKRYPDDLVCKVNELYQSGMTQNEVAIQVGLTQKVIHNLMHRHGIKSRIAVKRNQLGIYNSSWKGENATYTAFHLRVETARGKPKQCELCGNSDPDVRYEWANLSGNYSDVDDYKRMCISCHRRYDAMRRKQSGKPTSPRARKGVQNA